MRCQWGPSFEDMKPWIVAHRYSEFDRLHTEIEKLFPEYAYGAGDNKLPSLPQKDFFNNFDSAVIERRREGLENYFTVIITKLPKVLKCTLMEDFMFVRERVASIKQQMQIEVHIFTVSLFSLMSICTLVSAYCVRVFIRMNLFFHERCIIALSYALFLLSCSNLVIL